MCAFELQVGTAHGLDVRQGPLEGVLEGHRRIPELPGRACSGGIRADRPPDAVEQATRPHAQPAVVREGEDHAALRGGDPGHLPDALLRVPEVIDGGVAQHAVERSVGKRQSLRDAADERDRHALLGGAPPRARQHDGRRLERVDLEPARTQRARVPGVRRRHLEHATTGSRGERVDAGSMHMTHDEAVIWPRGKESRSADASHSPWITRSPRAMDPSAHPSVMT